MNSYFVYIVEDVGCGCLSTPQFLVLGVVAGLGGSLRLQWSGDIDLNDGELSKQYQLYRSRLAFVGALTLTSIRLLDNLEKLHGEVATDLVYIVKSESNC